MTIGGLELCWVLKTKNNRTAELTAGRQQLVQLGHAAKRSDLIEDEPNPPLGVRRQAQDGARRQTDPT